MNKSKFLQNFIKISVILYITYQNVVNISEVSAFDHQKAGEQYATTVKHIPKNSQEQYKFEQSAVIFCNDLDDIQEFNDKVILSNKYPKKLKFLVICEKSMTGKFPIPHKLSTKKGLILEFQYFLVNKAGKLELSTYEWFMEGKCNRPQLTHLNSFSKKSLKWENQLEIKDKFMNFNRCPITLQLDNMDSISGCIYKYEIISFEVNLFRAISSKGNFDTNIVYLHHFKGLPPHPDAQCVIWQVAYTIKYYNKFHITTSHTDADLGFILAPTELYTSYEKLLMPFDDLTWIFLIATFGFSFGFIFVIMRFAPWWIQKWIFGEGVRSPAYNLLGIFFGIGQLRVPVENSARIILMTFILFCLVIRTAYQGVFFEMFTHELRKPQAQTINDLYEQNYTIYSVDNFHILGYMNKSRRPLITTNDEYLNKMGQTGIVPEKFGILTYISEKSYVNPLFMAGFRDILKERVINFPAGLRFEKNNFLFHITNEAMQHLVSGGIIDQIKSYQQSFCVPLYEAPEWEPYVFSMDHLLFGFIIWLVPVGASLIVLTFELIWFHGKRATMRIIKSATVLYFILKRLQRGFGL